MLSRMSIRTRLVLLSITLLLVTVGTNLYLTRTLERASNSALESDRLVRLVESAQEVRTAIEELRYWQADLAVSLLTLSERNAEAARKRVAATIDRLATGRPTVAFQLRDEVAAYDKAAVQAVDAYTNDRRVIGNSLFGEARQHVLKIEELLAGLEATAANQWPEIAGFRAQMAAWEGEMIRLGRHLMGCLALSVDLAYDWFADGLADPQCGVRLLRYPPQPEGAAGNLLGAGAHSDWGSITILLQDEMAGLEVLNTDDAWILATPIEGTFVINLGQMMERFTGGLYRANLHRVRNNAAAQARHSVATFFELAPDYRMRVAPTCPGGDGAGVAPTIGQHLEDMARASYAA